MTPTPSAYCQAKRERRVSEKIGLVQLWCESRSCRGYDLLVLQSSFRDVTKDDNSIWSALIWHRITERVPPVSLASPVAYLMKQSLIRGLTILSCHQRGVMAIATLEYTAMPSLSVPARRECGRVVPLRPRVVVEEQNGWQWSSSCSSTRAYVQV